MKRQLLTISLRIGLITAGLILLYELSDQLLIYHYFKFEYYIAGAVIVALITGIVLTRRYQQEAIAINESADPLDGLTAKELRVLELIAVGKSNKEIASLNFTEMSTVKTHINNIFSKLRVKTRKDAVKVYHKHLERQKSTLSPPADI
jgi:DNA-binding CsgD family transcriptional regulator